MALFPVTDQDIDILARTIYGEARGELYKANAGLSALVAVANVINNRVQQQLWYGKTITDVCLKPWQFSCWNADDPNLTVIKAVTLNNSVFEKCIDIANATAQGTWPDLTDGSDHYYAIWLPRAPLWSIGKRTRAKIGCHAFFNINGRL